MRNARIPYIYFVDRTRKGIEKVIDIWVLMIIFTNKLVCRYNVAYQRNPLDFWPVPIFGQVARLSPPSYLGFVIG